MAAESKRELSAQRSLPGFQVGRDSLRKWLAAAGLRTTRRERAREVYQPRYRRDCLGELVQIDGCDHDSLDFKSRVVKLDGKEVRDHAVDGTKHTIH